VPVGWLSPIFFAEPPDQFVKTRAIRVCCLPPAAPIRPGDAKIIARLIPDAPVRGISDVRFAQRCSLDESAIGWHKFSPAQTSLY
jgi:hypothetical protein